MAEKQLHAFIRQAAERGLPDGVILMRDRGDSLWAVRSKEDINIDGYTSLRRGEYVAFSPNEATLRLAGGFIKDPHDDLIRSLSRFTGFSAEAARLFSAIIKAREANDARSLEMLEKELRQSAAKALRSGGGEGLYWCAIALSA